MKYKTQGLLIDDCINQINLLLNPSQ